MIRERPDAGRVQPEPDRTSGPVRQVTSVKVPKRGGPAVRPDLNFGGPVVPNNDKVIMETVCQSCSKAGIPLNQFLLIIFIELF